MSVLAAASEVAWTAGSPLRGFVIVLLCALAAIGTVWALPGRRDPGWRVFGGTLLLVAGGILAALLTRWALASSGQKPGLSYVYFWVFAAVALAGSVRVITHPKPVYSALYFVLTTVATAGLFLLMWAEFMAAALVLIYAGAIVVTYVFVIMLAAEASGSDGGSGASAGLPDHDACARAPRLAPIVGFLTLGLLLFLIFERPPAALSKNPWGTASDGIATGHTQQLGVFLFRYHFVNIQLAGLLLTLAMIGAIMIARKRIVQSESSSRQVALAESPYDVEIPVVLGPPPKIEDNPHTIPVVGTMNPRQKAYPEN
ncbi:MAG: NADH-quinone oxidoreductase subunit J [Phycisphaerales bacterium]|nr:NADH-quinone oxidoreductase subunit J [Phycisphaerales bacterium]